MSVEDMNVILMPFLVPIIMFIVIFIIAITNIAFGMYKEIKEFIEESETKKIKSKEKLNNVRYNK